MSKSAARLTERENLQAISMAILKLALPKEADLPSGCKQLGQGLGKFTPIELQRLSGRLPKPFSIFIPLFVADGKLIAFQTFDLVVLLVGIALYAFYSDKRKRQRALRAWEAQVQAETRYYAEQAARAQWAADELNRQARAHERDIRDAYAHFEAEDREEEQRHEAAKRDLTYRGEWQ